MWREKPFHIPHLLLTLLFLSKIKPIKLKSCIYILFILQEQKKSLCCFYLFFKYKNLEASPESLLQVTFMVNGGRKTSQLHMSLGRFAYSTLGGWVCLCEIFAYLSRCPSARKSWCFCRTPWTSRYVNLKMNKSIICCQITSEMHRQVAKA